MLGVALGCIAAVLLEELFLRTSRLRLLDDPDRTGDGITPSLRGRIEVFRRRYRFIRVVQFVVFGLLWVLVAEATEGAVTGSPLGQLTTALLLLLFIRVLGRRVVKSWPLLTVTALQQTLQAFLVMVMAAAGYGAAGGVGAPALVSGFSVVAATVASALSFSSSAVYLGRMSSRGARLFGEEPPPLAASEAIGRRALAATSLFLAASVAAGALSGAGFPRAADVAAAALLAVSALSLALCLDRGRVHHPAGMVTALLPYPLLLAAMVTGLFSTGS